NVIDYKLDKIAEKLIIELASSYKLNKFFKIRNETVVIQLIEKYCLENKLDFKFQFNLENYKFDCKVDDLILIEIDEPHHNNKRQREIDYKKDSIAKQNGFSLLRVNLDMDIIDIICYIENKLFDMKKITPSEKKSFELIYEQTANDKNFGLIRSKGDQALCGKTTQQMKNKLSVPKGRALADFLPTITIKARDFATEITVFNTKEKNLNNERQIFAEHITNNRSVRKILLSRGIKPEELPAEEDIKKLERRVISEPNKLGKNPDKLN